MLHSSIRAARLLLVVASSFAQSNPRTQLRPVTAPVKNAGVLHFGAGSWTRGATAACQGPDTITVPHIAAGDMTVSARSSFLGDRITAGT